MRLRARTAKAVELAVLKRVHWSIVLALLALFSLMLLRHGRRGQALLPATFNARGELTASGETGDRGAVVGSEHPAQTSTEYAASHAQQDPEQPVPTLIEFKASLDLRGAEGFAGVWAEGQFAFSVRSMEARALVPEQVNVAAVYRWALAHDVTGLLIHNYLGGTRLYDILPGERIAAIDGKGGVQWYEVTHIARYEALHYSEAGFAGPFRDWDCLSCGFTESVEDIQWEHYTEAGQLALQTCLEESGRVGLLILQADPLIN